MTPSLAPLAIVLPPLLAALAVVVFALHQARRARAIVLAGTLLSAAASVLALWHCAHGEILEYQFGGWAAPYGIVYRIDGLGAVMAALINGIGLAVFVYAGPSVAAELPGNEASFLATASLLVAALGGMAVTGDLFNLYVFLEIASITTYTLIASGGGMASFASFRYLLIGTLGASFYLLGLGYLFALTGTLNMADMAARLPAAGGSAAVVVALAMITTGLALKMALFPMHGWLPDAYTYAPSAGTCLIAALMTKVNAFALLRVLYGVLWPAIGPLDLPLTPLLGWLAAAGILAGSAMALAQTDLKRLLAYSSVSHIGYVALGIALGNANGLIGAMLHIVAHAMTKGCLFMIVGGVTFRFGARREAALDRLNQHMPVSMGALVVTALSMIGVPPTLGFFSKWYLLLGSLDASQPAFAAVLLLSSLLNAWYFFRWIERAYFAGHAAPLPLTSTRDDPDQAEGPLVAHAGEIESGGESTDRDSELPRAMLGPIVALASAVLVVGVLSYPLVRHVLSDAIDGLPGRSAVSAQVALPSTSRSSVAAALVAARIPAARGHKARGYDLFGHGTSSAQERDARR